MNHDVIKKEIIRNKSAYIGAAIIGIFILIAFLAPVIAPYDPTERVSLPYQKPCSEFLLGTNDIGQDIFSEMVFGTRISLSIGVLSAMITTIIGTILGMIAGYCGKIAERSVTALTDMIMCLPSLPITIVLVAIFGSGFWNALLIMSAVSWAGTARIIRAKVFSIKNQSYIIIQPMLGSSSMRTIFVHILPNIMDIITTRFAISVGSAIMTESSLAFLGISVGDGKSWGNVLHYAFYRSGIIRNYYWWYLPPIICISLCMLGFMMFANYNKKRHGVM